jgi:hypothetical protein
MLRKLWALSIIFFCVLASLLPAQAIPTTTAFGFYRRLLSVAPPTEAYFDRLEASSSRGTGQLKKLQRGVLQRTDQLGELTLNLGVNEGPDDIPQHEGHHLTRIEYIPSAEVLLGEPLLAALIAKAATVEIQSADAINVVLRKTTLLSGTRNGAMQESFTFTLRGVWLRTVAEIDWR